MIVLQPPLLFEGWGGCLLCLSGNSSLLVDFRWAYDCTAQSITSVQWLSFFCKAFSRTVFDSSTFSLFQKGQVFHELVCPLAVVLRAEEIGARLNIVFSHDVTLCG